MAWEAMTRACVVLGDEDKGCARGLTIEMGLPLTDLLCISARAQAEMHNYDREPPLIVALADLAGRSYNEAAWAANACPSESRGI